MKNCSKIRRFALLTWVCEIMKMEQAKLLVVDFLRLMEARDLAQAEALMAPDAQITFPGDRRFASQREVAAASAGRYQWIKKRFEDIEAFPADEAIIVYVRGTLYGLNLNDLPFEGVRFIDRFVIKDGRIVQQEVWNDLAETGVLARTA